MLLRQKRDEVPEGTLSCPDRNLAVFHHYRHYEGLRLLPSVCDSKLIQQTLIILSDVMLLHSYRNDPTCMVEITQYALKGQKLIAQGIALGNWDANLPP